MGSKGKNFCNVFPFSPDYLAVSEPENRLESWKKLAFPDNLSRSFTITDMKKNQKKLKHIPKDPIFFDDQGKEIN